ncbi:MAG: pseudouridine synthase [Cyanobium sp.]
MSPEDGWLPGAFNQGWTYRDRIDAASAGLGLVEYYSRRHRHSGPAIWRQRLENGEIRCNGELVRQERHLRAGDRLLWRRPPWWEGPVPAALPCLCDDGDLLVLAKPSGLPVLPAGGWVEHTVLRRLEQRHRDDPAGIPRPVHRLGRFTSGLLACARQPASRAWLSAQLRDSTAQLRAPERPSPEDGALAGAPAGGTRKVYRALLPAGVLDLVPGACRSIVVPIGRHRHPQLGQVWAAGGEGALPACSRLTLLEARTDGDLVEVMIESGRPHQIRIHCAALGAPLLGDPLYRPGGLPNPAALPGDGGYLLHALALRLRRPDGGVLDLWAPPPPLLQRRGHA